MTAQAAAAPRTGRLIRVVAWPFHILVGALLCLTPVTAVVALGWLTRRTGRAADIAAGADPRHVGWIMGPGGTGWLVRIVGGLAANVRAGVQMALSLGLAMLPVGALWSLAWWAGWQNSFTKGYEQAAAGPLVFFAGVGVFLLVWLHLPMAFAHQAATGRWLALFEWRSVRRAVRTSGWSYVLLAFATLLAALPLFARRGLVTFVEGIVPVDTMTPEQVAALAGQIDFVTAVWIFAALWFLRTWAGRVYARAMANEPRRWRTGRALRALVVSATGFGLVALIVVGQFLNHSWWAWVNHPFLLLPWFG